MRPEGLELPSMKVLLVHRHGLARRSRCGGWRGPRVDRDRVNEVLRICRRARQPVDSHRGLGWAARLERHGRRRLRRHRPFAWRPAAACRTGDAATRRATSTPRHHARNTQPFAATCRGRFDARWWYRLLNGDAGALLADTNHDAPAIPPHRRGSLPLSSPARAASAAARGPFGT